MARIVTIVTSAAKKRLAAASESWSTAPLKDTPVSTMSKTTTMNTRVCTGQESTMSPTRLCMHCSLLLLRPASSRLGA